MATKENSGIKKKKQLLAEIKTMNNTLHRIYNALQGLSANVKGMMKGDQDGPYWNGADAETFYKKAIKNLANNAKDYEAAYNMVNKLAVKAERAK